MPMDIVGVTHALSFARQYPLGADESRCDTKLPVTHRIVPPSRVEDTLSTRPVPMPRHSVDLDALWPCDRPRELLPWRGPVGRPADGRGSRSLG